MGRAPKGSGQGHPTGTSTPTARAQKFVTALSYISRRDDAAEVLAWLDSELFGPPSEPLWRRLGQVR